MGLNEFPPQPREGLMTKQPPCAPWPASSFNQGIWHLPKLLGFEEPGGRERKRIWEKVETRGLWKVWEDEKKKKASILRRNKCEFGKFPLKRACGNSI